MHPANDVLLSGGDDKWRNGHIGRPLRRRAFMPAGLSAYMIIWNTHLLEHSCSETLALIWAAGSIIVIVAALA